MLNGQTFLLNRIRGEYSAGETELRLTDLSWTESGCPSPDLFQQEQRFQNLMMEVGRFTVSGARFTLYGEGEQVLVFQRIEE